MPLGGRSDEIAKRELSQRNKKQQAIPLKPKEKQTVPRASVYTEYWKMSKTVSLLFVRKLLNATPQKLYVCTKGSRNKGKEQNQILSFLDVKANPFQTGGKRRVRQVLTYPT
eukprot:3169070-Amphidinium_carterae.1